MTGFMATWAGMKTRHQAQKTCCQAGRRLLAGPSHDLADGVIPSDKLGFQDIRRSAFHSLGLRVSHLPTSGIFNSAPHLRHYQALAMSPTRQLLLLLLLLLLVGVASIAGAHPGGLNSEGCHTVKKTGEYHCHGAAKSPPKAQRATEQPQPSIATAGQKAVPSQRPLPPGCFVGPRGGTYTITKSGKKNYGGC